MRFKESRKLSGILVNEIAKSMGISVSEYFQIENQEVVPSLEQIKAFCKTVNISSNYLLAITDEPLGIHSNKHIYIKTRGESYEH
jgi:transcriptional regulator with XRE-family HTH domain